MQEGVLKIGKMGAMGLVLMRDKVQLLLLEGIE